MIAACLVQHFLFSRLVLLHASPDLLSVFVAFASMSLGQRTGTTFGFASGLLTGFLTGDIGMSALVRTVEGFSAGFFHVPDERHATPTLKKRKLYLAALTALASGNLLQAILQNPQAQPFILRFLTLVVLATLLSMILVIVAYHLFLKKLLAD
jgi:hypothetical protein